ncbi:hypothetical protein Clacol_010391 [Clathrus columnatus]|uniref:Pterin-binding domain-containing protein n=1 Tax=Clathrus columnatus TaxID=1419009 RepID=A0AAV5AN56_9AGAM|nr:hypothetical protein Clacol_010391 [Clathrus columnatus]
MDHIVAVAIGSNVGNRYDNIESALRYLEANTDVVKICDTSFLYESEPMYVLEQDRFLNCAILIETRLKPLELLAFLKQTEDIIGRTKTIRNGPRAVDLDIIFYDDLTFDNRKLSTDGSIEGELIIPHFRVHEREFVLRPLMDIIPEFTHPLLKETVRVMYRNLMDSNPSTLNKVLPFPSPRHTSIGPILWPLAHKTYLMAAINATPDSFSLTKPSTKESAIEEGMLAVEHGADILDVGGYSTRPNATLVSAEEETNRVVPVIRGLRQSGLVLPISVDTFRPIVLRAAVEAGANCLNDVAALSGDESDTTEMDNNRCEEMKTTVRELGIPIIMMHSRGALNASRHKNYGPEGILQGVKNELGGKVTSALQSGIRRWNLIIDPGFGFSKTVDGNLELLRRFRDITSSDVNGGDIRNPLIGFPTLAGISRKSFLGNLLQRETTPQDREWATGAAAIAAVQQGADIVRIHRVPEIRDMVRIADRVWRVCKKI